jgi:hypothetical protein
LREQILRENQQLAEDSMSVIGNISIGGGIPMGRTPPV